MKNKYVDLEVLNYAVAALGESITKTFSMRKNTVTSLTIVKAIPTLLIGSSTEEVWCLRIVYDDDGTLKDSTPITHTIDLSLNDLISVDGIKMEVLDNLPPLADAKENVIYVIPVVEDGETIYKQYILSNNSFKPMGGSKIDLSGYVTTSSLTTQLGSYYKKTEVYNKTEVDNKIKTSLSSDLSSYYTKTETDDKLKTKADKIDVELLSGRIGILEGTTIDTTTIDAIIVDLRKNLDDKLEDDDLDEIRADIENLKNNKLNKTALPKVVSAFTNDANYITVEDEKSNNTKTLNSAKAYTDAKLAEIDAMKASDYYTKVEIDNQMSHKASTSLATKTANGLLSKEHYQLLVDIADGGFTPGGGGQDGETPVITVEAIDATATKPAGEKVTFKTTNQTKSFTLYDGLGIKSAKIDENNHLILTMTTNATIDAGNIENNAIEIKTMAINDSGNLIVTYTDNKTSNLGKVKGDKGTSITSVAMNDNKEMIITYSDNTIQNIGVIEGIQGKDGTGIKSITLNSNKQLIITDTKDKVYNLGVIKGDTGVGIEKIEIDDNYEVQVTYTDKTTKSAGKITAVFITNASLNDEGELIFTYNDGSTTNEGKINGVEGASIREYNDLELNQRIREKCYIIYNNQLYRVDTEFNCTKNFWFDCELHMTKLSTDTQLHDLYSEYVETTEDNPVLTFEEWFSKWIANTMDQPIVAQAKINIPAKIPGSLTTQTFSESTDTNIFCEDGTIKLPYNGSFILTCDTGLINLEHDNRKYVAIINKSQNNKMVAFKTTYPNGLNKKVYDTSFTQIISGQEGEEFEVKYASGTALSGAVTSIKPTITLYRMTYNQPDISIEDMYQAYVMHETDPMSYDDWVKSIFQRDQCRMIGGLEEEIKDTAKSFMLKGFTYTSGSRDLMPNDGVFTAPYSGLYYLRLQVRFNTPKAYPSRLYLVKNFKFGDTGYSARIIAQATDGYTTQTDYVESLQTVFWMNEGDYFTLGFESVAAMSNIMYTMADGFEYGLLSSGIGGGSSGGGAGVTSYDSIGYGTTIHEDELLLYKNRIYVANEDFDITQRFSDDSTHLTQIYGSGNGILDYDTLEAGEEIRAGEFILIRDYITVTEEDIDIIKEVDSLYEVITDFTNTGDWDTDKANTKKTLGAYDDYNELINKLNEEINVLKEEKELLQDTVDDLASILDAINRKVV